MHHERCLGIPVRDTSKEAKLHEGSASLMRLLRGKVPKLSRDAPKRGFSPAREICRLTVARQVINTVSN